MAFPGSSGRSAPGRRPWCRTFAALVAGLAAALALTVALAALAPLPPSDRGALAVLMAVPAWVAAALYAFLDRSAGRAWLVLLAIALAAGLAASLA
ncbi:hypothetical protein [Tautonia plasticadhaerens]|uniref:Uncharacterized protein n=1 Tax=Tautonia plasticadhaerens TaxID=2527974 RepID=A0A518GV07_9BACT|nr:hypothetical protein [Tautonia plasticadhaerens]QDV32417.1 hypothetical protein ElP_02490 [Tautonia plasticadhaerens]